MFHEFVKPLKNISSSKMPPNPTIHPKNMKKRAHLKFRIINQKIILMFRHLF